MGLLHYLLPCGTLPPWQLPLGMLGPHRDSWDPHPDSWDPSRGSAPHCVLWDGWGHPATAAARGVGCRGPGDARVKKPLWVGF